MLNVVKIVIAGQAAALLVTGGVLAGTAVSGANAAQPDAADPNIASVYRQSLTAPLKKAVSEVRDPEIAAFSQKLVNAYELDSQSQGSVSTTDAGAMAGLLPDVVKIQRTAMDLPLREAGKKLKDRELSDFYQSFISSIGVQ